MTLRSSVNSSLALWNPWTYRKLLQRFHRRNIIRHTLCICMCMYVCIIELFCKKNARPCHPLWEQPSSKRTKTLIGKPFLQSTTIISSILIFSSALARKMLIQSAFKNSIVSTIIPQLSVADCIYFMLTFADFATMILDMLTWCLRSLEWTGFGNMINCQREHNAGEILDYLELSCRIHCCPGHTNCDQYHRKQSPVPGDNWAFLCTTFPFGNFLTRRRSKERF